MKSFKTPLAGVRVVEPAVFNDDRGFFMETYHREKYEAVGIDVSFVQDNHSHSQQNVLRGLHYQLGHAQDKLVCALSGAIFDVAVDIRRGSPTFGQWYGTQLSAANHRQLFIPKGFAHGFCVLSETADILYKCSDFYSPEDEQGLLWSDPELKIQWPVKAPILSAKDAAYPPLARLPRERLPRYTG
ncbi:MAG: dTDP-4-dehydrorhamnose 3,5-epimerase [Desulfobacterales bacterium]